MNSVFGILRTTFEWAFYFALIGGIGEATLDISKHAATAHSKGLVSLKALNRSLH